MSEKSSFSVDFVPYADGRVERITAGMLELNWVPCRILSSVRECLDLSQKGSSNTFTLFESRLIPPPWYVNPEELDDIASKAGLPMLHWLWLEYNVAAIKLHNDLKKSGSTHPIIWTNDCDIFTDRAIHAGTDIKKEETQPYDIVCPLSPLRDEPLEEAINVARITEIIARVKRTWALNYCRIYAHPPHELFELLQAVHVHKLSKKEWYEQTAQSHVDR